MLKRFCKVCSILLVCVLISNMLPMSSFAAELQSSNTSQNTSVINDSSVEVLEEVTENRSKYSKEFILSNGLHMATVYAEPVHYEKDGKWEDIDNTLVANIDGTYKNTAGPWEVSFPQSFGSSQAVTITKDGHTLSFGMPQRLTGTGTAVMSANANALSAAQAAASVAQVQAVVDVTAEKEAAQYPETIVEKLCSQLTYSNVHSSTDITYDLMGEKVKESVVLKSYDSSLRGFRYTLNVGTMIPVLADEGHITFYDETQTNVIMVMPAPYMVDAAMEMSMDIDVSLTGSGSSYTLTYTLPLDWLAASERQWPVILDPVVQASLETTNIRDASIAENKTFGYTAPVLETGYYSGEGKQRSFLKFRTLPTLTSADMVVGATMTLYKFVTSSSTAPIEVHKVLGNWESETLTWANKPAYNSTVEDFVICRDKRYYNWDVTDIVRDWYATGNNYGMMFKASDAVENAGANNFKQFYSSDYGTTYKPTLQIWFRNSNGLENYWDYTSSSAGRAGTGYVNNYTGNLVWIRNVMGFSGNRMPVSINMVYNANDAANNDFGMGYGWRTNYNQRVYQWTGNTTYYVWEDSDGTKHYFPKQSTGVYKDEDGLELTLTTTGSGTGKYQLKDKNGNTSYFDTYGRLTKLENNQQTKSSITVTYTTASGKLISTIKDGAGRVYSFTYNSNSVLTRISYKGTGSTELTYAAFTVSGGDLTRITDKDGKYAVYAYNTGHILNSATDVDGYKISCTYNVSSGTYAPCRVTGIREYDGSVSGGNLTLSYANNQTIVRDQINGTSLAYQFNNWGNTVSVQDSEGRAQFMEFDRNVWNDTTGKGNQLNLSSKLQNTVINLLYDSSFEYSTLWSVYASSSGMSNSIASTGYIGSKSLYIANSSGGTLRSSSFTAEAGATYTFSGYVKTTAGKVQLGIVNANSSTDAVYSSAESTNGGWTRVQVSYTNTSSAAKTMYALFKGLNSATAYLDCVQVEKSPTASRYNMVQNGDFRTSNSGWTLTGGGTGDGVTTLSTKAISEMGGYSYKITGNYTGSKYATHTITASGSAGDSFVFSGWAKGNSASLANLQGEQAKDFALKFTITNTDGTKTTKTVSFNPDVEDWQFVSGALVAEKSYTKVFLEILYINNANTVYFDGLQVFKEQYGTSYTYDSKGNVISVKDLQNKTTTYEYDANSNLTKILQDNKAKMTYTYDGYHNVKTAKTEEGHTYSFTYDAYGNNTKVSISSGTQTLSSSATYTAGGNLLSTTTDALGKVTTYGYNTNTGLLDWVKYPEDTDATKTTYSYDSMYRTASAAVTTDTGLNLSASYGYTDDMLTSITTPTTSYSFTYGNFSLRSAVKIGSRTLASYSYSSGNNRLTQLSYGNGDYVRYTYDSQGRVTKKTYEDGAYESYAYDRSGNLATVTDSETGTTTTYYYDLINRQVGYREKSATLDHTVSYVYNEDNNIASMTEAVNGVSKTYSYTYNDDNRVTSMTVDGITVNYTYDAFGRVSQQTGQHNGTTFLSNTIGYTGSGTATSGQISSYNGLTYTYDDNGNILTVSDGTNTTGYVYDTQNQLVRENNPAAGKTWTWVYDNAGNILSRNEYAYTTGTLGTPVDTVSYTYGDSSWGDLLTAYDGKPITYDTIGNPLTYDGWTFNWQHGRQLASMSKDGTTWTNTYDANGMRIKRTDGTTTYQYVYNGGLLTQIHAGIYKFDITYDALGTPLAIRLNNYTYRYVTNQQGDVTGILDEDGNQIITYVYDAWGNVTKIGDEQIGDFNPLLYRGYVYDWETGLYYLESRYYDPEIGRWINADDSEILLEDYEAMLQYNLFAYCWNNPVNMYDPDGYWTLALAGGGYLATAGTLGASNIWNPVGWVILGTVVVTTVVVVATNVYNSEKTSSSNEADPYARPGQKKQGRERKNKARKSKDWKPRSNPKPPKKHTPGRDHRRYK